MNNSRLQNLKQVNGIQPSLIVLFTAVRFVKIYSIKNAIKKGNKYFGLECLMLNPQVKIVYFHTLVKS